MTTECTVCIEDAKDSQMISCPSCELSSCQKCTRRYLLTSILDAHCMGCKVRWGDKFLLSVFPKSWVNGLGKNGYRASRKDKLLEREKARIPESMVGSIENIRIDRERRIHNIRVKAEN